MDKIVDVLKEHGWPPATLLTLCLAIVAIWFLYEDNKEMHHRWENLATENLKVNTRAFEQRERMNKAMDLNIQTLNTNAITLRQMEARRLKQREVDNQLTAMAIQALESLAAKQETTVQMKSARELIKDRK